MFRIIVGVFFAAITSLAAADGHGSKMESCIKAFSDLQIGKWTGSGSGMNSTLGEHFAFTWESEITEKNGVYTSSGKSSRRRLATAWRSSSVRGGGSLEFTTQQPQQLRFNRNNFGSTEVTSVQTKNLWFNRSFFG